MAFRIPLPPPTQQPTPPYSYTTKKSFPLMGVLLFVAVVIFIFISWSVFSKLIGALFSNIKGTGIPVVVPVLIFVLLIVRFIYTRRR